MSRGDQGPTPSAGFLRGLSLAEAAAALACALDVADASETRRLGGALADLVARLAAGPAPAPPRVWRLLRPSARDPGEDALAWTICLRAAASSWGGLAREARAAVASAARGRWGAAISALPPVEFEQARRSVLELATETGDPSLLGALVDLLEDPRTELATSAEEVLTRQVRLASREAGSDPESLEALRVQIARAVSRVDVHACRGVLAAAIQLLEPGLLSRARRGSARDPLAAWHLESTLGASAAGRNSRLGPSLRVSRGAASRARAWEWLVVESMSEAALARLGRTAPPSEHAGVLARWHLALRPARGARVGGAGARMLPDARTACSLPADARRGVVRLGAIARLPVPEWALCDPDAMVRLAACGGAGPDCGDFIFDASASISRSAMLAWSAAGVRIGGRRATLTKTREARAGFCAKLARSPHAAVRRAAAQDAFLLSPFEHGSESSRSCAWGMLRDDRGAFLGSIRERLADAGTQVSALLLVRRLGLAREFADGIMRIASEAERASPGSCQARTVATAVAAATAVEDPRATRVIAGALHAADDRVRANAVESLAARVRCGSGDVDAVLISSVFELKNDDAHRVRANVARTMAEHAAPGLGAGAARESLAAMLADRRPMHRLAGVWAAEKSARLLAGSLGEIPARVSELAADDPDVIVRSRAEACARLLGLRRGGAAPAEIAA